MSVVTRIAPSPTGSLHIGHVRTTLYNYAYARHHGGKFIVRIEDTDRKRHVESAVKKINWLLEYIGLESDENAEVGGPNGPYISSERLDIYREYLAKLLQSGHAYYCFCTQERLASLREQQQSSGEVPRYDKKCSHLSTEEVSARLSTGESHIVRLNVPGSEEIVWHDDILGDIRVNTESIDDQVLWKSDDFPTYFLPVVVDDHLMGVTHIIRGSDWISSTIKQILIYRAFNWDIPHFAHLPNLRDLGETKKLSKRHGSSSLEEFLIEGYLPQALVNFLMFVGWNPGTDKEIYTLAEFVKDFTLERVHKSDLVVFDREKLLWFNGHYIRNMSDEDLLSEIRKWKTAFDINLGFSIDDRVNALRILSLVKDRLKKLNELDSVTHYFFKEPSVEKELFVSFVSDNSRLREIITTFSSSLESFDSWNAIDLDAFCHDFIAKHSYKPKEAFMSLRLAVTGEKATPPIFDVLSVLGKDTTLRRLNALLQKF